ncbi:hypothetical protein B0H14DRAFT_2644360 [Mycena olivaceomarginata]|nr:hypothetical protein B0H14DRAFT_2644360 [Mycena olivaceomarginata]
MCIWGPRTPNGQILPPITLAVLPRRRSEAVQSMLPYTCAFGLLVRRRVTDVTGLCISYITALLLSISAAWTIVTNAVQDPDLVTVEALLHVVGNPQQLAPGFVRAIIGKATSAGQTHDRWLHTSRRLLDMLSDPANHSFISLTTIYNSWPQDCILAASAHRTEPASPALANLRNGDDSPSDFL